MASNYLLLFLSRIDNRKKLVLLGHIWNIIIHAAISYTEMVEWLIPLYIFTNYISRLFARIWLKSVGSCLGIPNAETALMINFYFFKSTLSHFSTLLSRFTRDLSQFEKFRRYHSWAPLLKLCSNYHDSKLFYYSSLNKKKLVEIGKLNIVFGKDM